MDDAGLDVLYSGAPGSVIGRLVSQDQTGDYSFDVPVKDPLAGMARAGGSYPWRLDNGYSTVVHLKNVLDKPVQAVVQIRYADGSYNPERIPLQAHQTIAIDIAAMRDAQKPDIRNSVMPKDFTTGQVIWWELTPGSLIGRAEVANIKQGIAGSFSCGSGPCPPSFDGASLDPSSMSALVGDFGSFRALETDMDCLGTLYGPFTASATWSSSNTSVVTVDSSGNASCPGPGTAVVTATFIGTVYECGNGCVSFSTTATPSGGVTVTAPSLSGPSSITRASSATFTLKKLSANRQISGWKFTDSNGNTVNGPTTNPTSWGGVMVTGGTVHVTVVEGSQTFNLSASITVNARTNFAFTAVSATKEPNGFQDPRCGAMSVANPPSSGSDPAVGLSCYRGEFNPSANHVGDGGPNQGYKYVASVSDSAPDGTATAFSWVIAQDIENTSSDFYLHQCGNYDPTTNPNGFISGADLLADVTRHESGSVNSHYHNYVAAQNAPSNNLGVIGEMQVGLPSKDLQSFLTGVELLLDDKRAAIEMATGVEPCGTSVVTYDANCRFQGFVNVAPYEPCQ